MRRLRKSWPPRVMAQLAILIFDTLVLYFVVNLLHQLAKEMCSSPQVCHAINDFPKSGGDFSPVLPSSFLSDRLTCCGDTFIED